MKKVKLTLLALVTSFTLTSVFGQGVVSRHGRMTVEGNQIKDKNGTVFSVAGNSIFWSGFETVGAKFYTKEVVDHLAKNWKSGIVRAAMAVEEADGASVQPTSPQFPADLRRNPSGLGYYNNPQKEMAKIKTVIDAAIANDIYVLVDFHTHFAQLFKDDAIKFFTDIAKEYGNNDHIIYEIFNEPIGVEENRANGADGRSDGKQTETWNNVIRPYAIDVIKAIRAIDPDNLIVVGTPRWSQGVDFAAENPITRTDLNLSASQELNLAYTLHFYAAQVEHNALIDAAQKAMNKGIALFVTEWGTVAASGDGEVDELQTLTWMKFLKDNNISHANWSISDKFEGASAIKGNASVAGLLNDELTQSGDFVKCLIESWDTAGFVNCKAKDVSDDETSDSALVPNGEGIKFEVEAPTQLNTTTKSRIDFISPNLKTDKFDTEGILTGFVANESVVVHANGFLPDGTYTIQVVLSTTDSQHILVLLRDAGNTVLKTAPIPNTGGLNKYEVVSIPGIEFDTNRQDITIAIGGSGNGTVNMESFYLSGGNLSNTEFENDLSAARLYPNPVLGEGLTIETGLGDVTYTITDMSGSTIVRDVKFDGGKIDFNALSPGTYLVQLSINGAVEVHKITKK